MKTGKDYSEYRILIADDEPHILKLLTDFITAKGFSVLAAKNGTEALEFYDKYCGEICLVILDVMMPEKDGWFVLNEIRKKSDVPVILLTAKGEETDQLIGFDLGGDDYVMKPFSPSILMARVDALLKRTGVTADSEVTRHKKNTVGLFIDKDGYRILIDGEEIEVTPKEFELLCYFDINKGIALSREKILNAVWKHDYFGDLRTVDTHVKQLRAKMGDYSDRIKTVRGVGYRYENSD